MHQGVVSVHFAFFASGPLCSCRWTLTSTAFAKSRYASYLSGTRPVPLGAGCGGAGGGLSEESEACPDPDLRMRFFRLVSMFKIVVDLSVGSHCHAYFLYSGSLHCYRVFPASSRSPHSSKSPHSPPTSCAAFSAHPQAFPLNLQLFPQHSALAELFTDEIPQLIQKSCTLLRKWQLFRKSES